MGLSVLFAIATAVLAFLLAYQKSSPSTSHTANSGVPPGSGAFFDTIAPRYDLLNRLISLGMDTEWRRSAIDAALPAASVLDVSTGTADLALALAKRSPSTRVVGIDPSREMLALGHLKIASGGTTFRNVELQLGVAEKLPFDDGSFDAVLVAFGVRNFQQRDKGIAEMVRVLKVGGRLVILELSTPSGTGIKDIVARKFINEVMPRIAALISGSPSAYRYLSDSMAKFPTAEKFKEILRANGMSIKSHKRLAPFGVGPDLYTTVKRSKTNG